jgi:hypothetical protein
MFFRNTSTHSPLIAVMKRNLRHWSVPTLLSLLVIGGCTETLVPTEIVELPPKPLIIAKVDEAAPKLIDTHVSFWAVRGEDRQVEINYEATSPYGNGTCLRFVVPALSLLRDANGNLIANGDSVRIEIRVVDASRYLFEFEPSGVQFDPLNPARIEIRYTWLAADANGDGSIDARDSAYVSSLAIWRQERPDDPWTKLSVSRFNDIQEIHANVSVLTRFALASD